MSGSTPVAVIAAREQDVLDNARVLYGLVESSGNGEIVSSSGNVSVAPTNMYVHPFFLKWIEILA